jgi:hypothetical protein
MSQNLFPIRKFAYIFDRRQFGMIGSVTLRDPSLEWRVDWKGSPLGRGKPLEEGRKRLGFLGRHGHDMHDRPAGNARDLCAGS